MTSTSVLFALHSVEVYSVIIKNIILLAMCDVNYCFKYINVGACGTDSDSIIFRDSNLYAKLQSGEINLPEPRHVDTDTVSLHDCRGCSVWNTTSNFKTIRS